MLKNVLLEPALIWKRWFGSPKLTKNVEKKSPNSCGSETRLYRFFIDFGLRHDPHLETLGPDIFCCFLRRQRTHVNPEAICASGGWPRDLHGVVPASGLQDHSRRVSFPSVPPPGFVSKVSVLGSAARSESSVALHLTSPCWLHPAGDTHDPLTRCPPRQAAVGASLPSGSWHGSATHVRRKAVPRPLTVPQAHGAE